MASSIECLTDQKLQSMRGASPNYVRRMLCHCLNWSYLSDEDSGDLRHIIVIDILQDHICFCFTCLFTIRATNVVTRFVNFILLKSPCWSITDTIAYLTTNVKSKFNSTMSEENVKCYVNFFRNEFLKVYKLIQFVFSQTRHEITREMCLKVCTPHYLPRLYGAKPAEMHEYEKKIEIINEEEIRKSEMRENLKRAFDGEKRMIIEEMKKENKIITTNDEMTKMIEVVIKAHIDCLSHNMKIELDGLKDTIKLQDQRNNIPEPTAMMMTKAEDKAETPKKGKKLQKSSPNRKSKTTK